MRRVLWALSVILAACMSAFLLSCGRESVSSPVPYTPTALPSSISTPAPTPTLVSPRPSPVGIPAGSGELIRLAEEDLAERLGIALDKIALVEVEEVNWPNAGLGCPKPGMMYAQVITPGYRLVFSAEGKNYEYHSDQQRVILCEK